MRIDGCYDINGFLDDEYLNYCKIYFKSFLCYEIFSEKLLINDDNCFLYIEDGEEDLKFRGNWMKFIVWLKKSL